MKFQWKNPAHEQMSRSITVQNSPIRYLDIGGYIDILDEYFEILHDD